MSCRGGSQRGRGKYSRGRCAGKDDKKDSTDMKITGCVRKAHDGQQPD